MVTRNIFAALEAALSDRPVVVIHGARQTGKTTLIRSVRGGEYRTLDDSDVAAAARDDAKGFLRGFTGPVALDEVQHAPGLFRAIKASVDEDRTPGRFLLTGSANVLLVPRMSESLAGRMELIVLWPLSQGEIEGVREEFIDSLFAKTLSVPSAKGNGPDLLERVLTGGYPEVVSRIAKARRGPWFRSYIQTILERDVREAADIEGLTKLPRVLALAATRTAGMLNLSDFSRGLSIPHTTLHRYFALLEMVFLIRLLPAWTTNRGLRLLKAPKVHLCDTGLAAHLMGVDHARLKEDGNIRGPMVENFVVMELTKQATWSKVPVELFHFRSATREVDVVLEAADGRIVGVEVKASDTVTSGDFAGLRALAAAAGKKFVRGVVLHTGRNVVPFDANLHAVPIAALWGS